MNNTIAKQLPPTEEQECILLVQYLEILRNQGKVILYTHIPNETYTKDWGTKMKNKRLGVKKGFPDYLIVGQQQVICIEMKRIKGSTVSLEQKEWAKILNDRAIQTFLAHGFEEAKQILDNQL